MSELKCSQFCHCSEDECRALRDAITHYIDSFEHVMDIADFIVFDELRRELEKELKAKVEINADTN